VFLARCGFYDGTIIHRVAKDFVIQGGDPTGTGGAGPGYPIPDELPTGPGPGYPTGSLAMANAGPNSGGSQFFIVTGRGPPQNNYSLFGYVISGQEAIEQVPSNPPDDGRPTQTITVNKVTITAS
jgi:peptidylprolyl isomerase